jgi:site-specific DNA-methyltransferase (adenine-specific)
MLNIYYKDDLCILIQGECIDVMNELIESELKFDAIITDPPYGTTACKWDNIIPFDKMWGCLTKLRKDNAPIVLFGSEPFSSALRMSNIKEFKYDWIWNKLYGTNIYDGNTKPMKYHEIISVFYNKQPTFNKKMFLAKKENRRNRKLNFKKEVFESVYGNQKQYIPENEKDELRNPISILEYSNQSKEVHRTKRLHPTQKPLELIEYLIETYTNDGDIILDFTCGSGTTLIAARNLNRKCYGIELEEKYCEIAKNRLENLL